MFRASAFKLNTYRECPLKYKFIYIDRVAKDYEVAKPYLTMGSHVHNALYDFYDKTPEDKRDYKTLESLLRKRWTENRKGFKDIDEERTFGIEALQMLRLFAHKMNALQTPIMLEDYYDADIDDQITLLGRIDRVDEDGDSLHVIDYKTGKHHNEENSRMQLLMYSYIVSRSEKKQVARASNIYLRSYEWYTIEPSEEDFEAMIQDVRERVQIIQSDRTYEAQPGDHCRFCDMVEICSKKEEVLKMLEENENKE